MTKFYLYPIIFILLFMTACSAANGLQAASASSDDTVPLEARLAIGTLQLKDTEQAVTHDQAGELLVMWQVYRELSTTDTAAQAEFDAVIAQVQETMTDGQLQAITNMKLTQQNVSEVVQAQKITSSSSNSSNANSVLSNGGMPAGGPPDAGGLPFDGSKGGPQGSMGGILSNTSTGQSQSTGTGSGIGGTAGVPTALVDTLIQYLEQVASS